MKKTSAVNIKIKISLALLLALAAFTVVQYLSNKGIENMRISEQQIIDSGEISRRAEAVEAAIEGYTRKRNAFILTGNINLLAGSEEDVSSAITNLREMRELAKSAEQTQLLSRLDSAVKVAIKFTERVLITYDKGNVTEAVELINEARGRHVADIEAACLKIQQLEEARLERIILANDSFSRRIEYMDYAATLFGAIVIIFSLFILFQDINKRIIVENKLRIAREKAEESAVLKEQFMANMSHEIRTPMNTVLGFANLLGRTKLDNKQTTYIKAIQASSENLLRIIDDILDFSKIEAGLMRIQKTSFSIEALLHSVEAMLMPKAAEKNIRLEFQVSETLPESVIGDPTRLTQILVNLIGNALKFTDEGSVSVKAELLKYENEDAVIQFTVKDTGIGIPKEKLEEIFERFNQAHSDTGRKYGGSGLGLAIVKRLVELQGGAIRVESAQDVGSSFTFVIPYAKSHAAHREGESQSIESPLKAKTKIKILVAEDNPLNQRLIGTLLAEWNIASDTVDNGKSAVEKLKSSRYDLVLLDIQMPEMNGYEAARHIRDKLHLDIPIIAMTAHVLPGEKEKCLSYGMTDYLAKPIRESELRSLIAKYAWTAPSPAMKSMNNGASTNGRVTNFDYLNALARSNPRFTDEMKRLFLAECPEELDELEQAIVKKDFDAIRAIAHKIKSTIVFVGLDLMIGKELEEMESHAEKQVNLSRIKKLFAVVNEASMKAIEELNEAKKRNRP